MPQLDDPQMAAFRRLLADAHHGGQAKVDALVALVQRTINVVPWPGGIEGWRTLVNSEGVAALPIFTSFDELTAAASRYGWLDASGRAPHTEIGARAALNYAIRENLSFVVIDITSEHALEITRREFEPLLTPAARRDSAGPYAATGRISSDLIRAVRPTPAPPRPTEDRVRMTPSSALRAPRIPDANEGFTTSTGFHPSAGAATFGGGTSVAFVPISDEPTDALLDELASVLRNYPEVEWASFCLASRGPSAPAPTVCVRIDAGFRQRVNDIMREVRRAGVDQGASLDVLLLDDSSLMRAARGQGVVFYPWRK